MAHNGQLNEQNNTDPVNCYSIAKDSLRRFIANSYKKMILNGAGHEYFIRLEQVKMQTHCFHLCSEQ